MSRIGTVNDTVEDLKLAFRVFDKEDGLIPTSEFRFVD